jgi:hypothetical protein
LRGNDAGSVDARGESVDRAVRLTRMVCVERGTREEEVSGAMTWGLDSRAVGFLCSGEGVDPADLTDAFPLGGLPILHALVAGACVAWGQGGGAVTCQRSEDIGDKTGGRWQP